MVYLGRGDAGRDRYKWATFDTRREAETHLNAVLAQLQHGGLTAPSRMSVGAYLDRWLHDYAKPRVRPNSYRAYGTAIHTHLTPDLGAIPLMRLTAPAVEAWLAKMGRKTYTPPVKKGKQATPHPLSSATIHQAYRTLRAALRQAVAWGMLSRSPLSSVKPPRVTGRQMRVWDEEQARLFLATAKRSSVHYPLYLTAILTGMRQGELLALRWRDVDLAFSRISVQQTLHRIKGAVVFADVKTARSRRTIPIPEILVRELEWVKGLREEYRKLAGAGYVDHDLVFCQPIGKPLHAHNVTQRDLRRVIKAAGVPRLRFHDLRHCCATMLLRYGVHARIAQEILGHDNISTTMGTYSHVLAPSMVEASTLLADRLLGGAAFAGHLQNGGSGRA